MSVIAMAFSVVTVVGFCVLAISYARRPEAGPIRSVPTLASSAIAWGGAFLQAVVVTMHAFTRDRTDGVVELFRARTTSLRGYLVARVAGLAALLAVFTGGGTLVVSAVSIAAAAQGGDALPTTKAALGAVVYGLAFALVISPIAFATLGPRSRGGGYLALLLVLIVPDLLSSKLDAVLPSGVAEVCAIPSALAALRASIGAGAFDGLRFLRALVALVTMAGVVLLFVQRAVGRLEGDEP